MLYLIGNLGMFHMPLSIEDPETERLAQALAKLTGESITTATKRAIEELFFLCARADPR